MLVIPAFKACMQSALIRANIKPPVELVVANFSTVGAKESLSDYFAAITTSGRNISDVYSIRWTKVRRK